jgi:hypothetical protein
MKHRFGTGGFIGSSMTVQSEFGMFQRPSAVTTRCRRYASAVTSAWQSKFEKSNKYSHYIAFQSNALCFGRGAALHAKPAILSTPNPISQHEMLGLPIVGVHPPSPTLAQLAI